MGTLRGNYIDLDELDAAIEAAKQSLGPEVLRVRYNVREDMGGDPAIYFRVLFRDSAVEAGSLRHLSEKISEHLFEKSRARDWGLIPYMNVRIDSEQALLNDPDWN